MLLLLAILAFLGIYVGPSDMSSTLLKVVVAVAISAAVFIGANLLFDQAYPRWTLFNVIVGAIGGFLFYVVLECNGLLRQLYDKRVSVARAAARTTSTPGSGGSSAGPPPRSSSFLLSAPRQQLARLPMAVVGFTALRRPHGLRLQAERPGRRSTGPSSALRRHRRRRARRHRPAAGRRQAGAPVRADRASASAG